MTAVEFLAERYNYITWMRNRDEISAGTADEWRAKFLKEAKEMEAKEMKANAQLIAAAHELLGALQMCWASLQTYGDHQIIDMYCEKAINKALGL